jgi:hypothetical protein
MQNLNPKRSLTRRQVRLTTLAFVAAAFGVFACTISVILTTIPVVNTQSSAYGLYTLAVLAVLLFGALLIAVGIGVVIRALTLRGENDLAKVAGTWLSQHLDARYTFIRNYNRPGVGYIDAVLVGPPGALVFRILDTKGDLFNEGASWVKGRRGGGYDVLNVNPTREAIADIRKLREHLSKHRLADVPVYGVIVFNSSDRDLRITAQQPTVPPTHLHRLLDTLKNDYFAKDRIDAARAQAVVSLLMGD